MINFAILGNNVISVHSEKVLVLAYSPAQWWIEFSSQTFTGAYFFQNGGDRSVLNDLIDLVKKTSDISADRCRCRLLMASDTGEVPKEELIRGLLEAERRLGVVPDIGNTLTGKDENFIWVMRDLVNSVGIL